MYSATKPSAALSAVAKARHRFISRPLALWPGHEPLLRESLLSDSAAVLLDQPAAPNFVVLDGVAVIPIQGVLVHGRTWCFDETDYGDISRMLSIALADPSVKAICLHVNSPGGEVAGCFDLADEIFAARGVKPMWAIVDENAYSAAYALASAADRIIVPRTGGTGSIGVISMHIDVTQALKDAGIKVTTIQFGARKSDTYPTTPLSDEARDRFQADVDRSGQIFVELVARNRGLSTKKVRATEAGTFIGGLGVHAGLADRVMAAREAFTRLSAIAG